MRRPLARSLVLGARRQLWSPLAAGVAPALWADAGRTSSLILSGNSASQWSSLAGSGADLTQATGSAQLTYEPTGFGGYAPCLSADGGDWMQATIAGLQSYTALDVYLVFQATAAAAADTNTLIPWGYRESPAYSWGSSTGVFSGEKVVFAYGAGGRLGATGYTRAANTPQILNTRNSTTGTQLFADGAAIALDRTAAMTTASDTSPASIAFASDVFYLFSNAGTAFSPAAKIKELIIFPLLLSEADRQKVEGYLAHNNWRIYGQPVPLAASHPYYSAPPY